MSSSQITTTLTMHVLEQPSQRIRVRMIYRITDPYAVHMMFAGPAGTGPVTWVFARDLLARGLDETAPAGEGDVRVGRAEADEYLTIELLPGSHQRRVLFARRAEVASFVTQIYRRVPSGQESEWIDWSAGLDLLLGRGRSA